ncbi:thermophilic serine proteinase precursor [archaeon BMS3Abin17]|nr:thermophilic serine proteinase precursor [archaeon BMS3Abin17]
MKIKYLIGFLILITLILFVSSSSRANKISEEVYKNLGDGKVRVIVGLKEPAPEKGFFFKTQKTPSEINSEKEEIRNKIISQVKEENLKHIFKESIAIEVSEKELNALGGNPNVKSIKIDRVMKAFLQDSVPLINASTLWPKQISGINITGIDEAICVIDTGINNTHPDLQGRVVAEYCYCSATEGEDTYCCLNNQSENFNAADNNGHGTHVAGIAAASGGIKGVAISSGIVAIKVLNSSGSGFSSDIQAAIDWCVDNSSIYNISVISMSLGGGQYNDYCNNDSLAPSINSAVAKNISVIVATGNNGISTQIASPACVENATAVGATDKSDNIASYSNRNNITDLFAPGSNINSTEYLNAPICSEIACSGLYAVASGTSMAAPHVAGAFALVRQFYRLQSSRVLTPSEIQNALNNTGALIDDSSGSGLNFSRIDIYSAVLSFDEIPPNVNLISPADNFITFNTNQTFICNATDALELSNITFYLWNSSSDLINQTTTGISSSFSETSFNVIGLSIDSYTWNCFAFDSNGNSAYAEANFSFNIANISVSLESPVNNTHTNQNQTNLICSTEVSSNFKLINLTFFVWNSSQNLVYNLTKNISGTSNSTIVQYNLSDETSYFWNCRAYNNASQYSFAESNYTITYDATRPNITLINPSNSATYTSNSQQITFTYNITDNFNIANCSLIINKNISLTNSSVTNLSLTQNFTQTFIPGNYNWSVNCTDSANNRKNSSQRIFTVSAPPVVAQSTGGGGGTSASKTYTLNNEQISSGYTKELKKNDKIAFTFFDEKTRPHTLTLNYLGKDFVNITIQSTIIKLVLGIGQSAKLNLTSPSYYNLYVKLENIINKKAKITIQTIHEEIPRPKQQEITGNAVENEINEESENQDENIKERIKFLNLEIKKLKIIIQVFVPAFIVAIVILLLRKRNKKRKTFKSAKQ